MYKFHEIHLSSGRIASFDSFHVTRTYAELMEGSPDANLNQKIIDRAATAMSKIWGDRRCYVVPPAIEIVDEAGRRFPRLPDLIYHAWLTSSPIADPWCGSELVVVWFGPYDKETPVPMLVERAVKDLAWEELAQDFDY